MRHNYDEVWSNILNFYCSKMCKVKIKAPYSALDFRPLITLQVKHQQEARLMAM